MTEFPEYDSCSPCDILKPVNTRIGFGYGCPVCQMTYIQVAKGAFIPFDQAMRILQEKQEKKKESDKRASIQMNQAKLRSQSKKNRKRRR
jgi:hypothetical protein